MLIMMMMMISILIFFFFFILKYLFSSPLRQTNVRSIWDAERGRLRRLWSGLNAALSQFYGSILPLSKVYKWQEARLPMTTEGHTHNTAQQPSDPSKWGVPSEFQGRFYTSTTMIGMGTLMGSKRRSRSPPSHRRIALPGPQQSISWHLWPLQQRLVWMGAFWEGS